MIPNPTNRVGTIEIKGQPYELNFDLNTYAAFENVTHKFFPDFLADLQTAISEGSVTIEVPDPDNPGATKKQLKDPMGVIRKMSFNLLRAFIWSALHFYDKNDDPVWPLTINQLGKLLDMPTLVKVLPQLITSTSQNLPTAKRTDGEEKPTSETPTTVEPGGSLSGLLDAGVLDSVEKSSVG